MDDFGRYTQRDYKNEERVLGSAWLPSATCQVTQCERVLGSASRLGSLRGCLVAVYVCYRAGQGAACMLRRVNRGCYVFTHHEWCLYV